MADNPQLLRGASVVSNLNSERCASEDVTSGPSKVLWTGAWSEDYRAARDYIRKKLEDLVKEIKKQ